MKSLGAFIYTFFIFLTGVFFGAWLIFIITPQEIAFSYPNGYDVLDELNNYREENGIPDFELYYPLCNNIASRWDNYIKTNSHQGLEEFRLQYMPQIKILSEILAPGSTAEEVVDNWASSPSHDLYIKNNSKICVYSASGYSVALLTN